VVNKLSQFLFASKIQHWTACKHLLQYLKGTIGLGLLFTPTVSNLALTVYMDLDHAGYKVTRKFTSGLCVFLGSNLLLWSSRKQSIVARSVGEANYQAMAQGVTEVMWLKSLFTELGYSLSHVPVLWCDNLATKSIAENSVFHSRTKHIEINVHFVREKVENAEIDIRYVPTLYQVADIFTKRLSRDRFSFLCNKLGLRWSLVHSIMPNMDEATQLGTTTTRRSTLRGNVEGIMAC